MAASMLCGGGWLAFCTAFDEKELSLHSLQSSEASTASTCRLLAMVVASLPKVCALCHLPAAIDASYLCTWHHHWYCDGRSSAGNVWLHGQDADNAAYACMHACAPAPSHWVSADYLLSIAAIAVASCHWLNEAAVCHMLSNHKRLTGWPRCTRACSRCDTNLT